MCIQTCPSEPIMRPEKNKSELDSGETSKQIETVDTKYFQQQSIMQQVSCISKLNGANILRGI